MWGKARGELRCVRERARASKSLASPCRRNTQANAQGASCRGGTRLQHRCRETGQALRRAGQQAGQLGQRRSGGNIACGTTKWAQQRW